MHWKHSRFEIANIILANCHTYDEAYRVLCELEEDRDFSIKSSMAESKRASGKVIFAKSEIRKYENYESDNDQHLMMRAKADLEETDARTEIAQACLDEARRELSFIRSLKIIIHPYRVFKDYPEHQAHQLCQPIEWKYDMCWKAYNMLCSMGGVSHEHLMLIHTHPSSKEILTGIENLKEKSDQNLLGFVKDKREIMDIMLPNDSNSQNLITNFGFFDDIDPFPLLEYANEENK